MAKCEICGREIDIMTTENGESLSVNTEYLTVYPMSMNSKYQNIITDDGRVVLGVIPQGALRGRVPHWVTCPGADRFS